MDNRIPPPELNALVEQQHSGIALADLTPTEVLRLEEAYGAGTSAFNRELEAIASTREEERPDLTPGVLAGALIGQLDELISTAIAEPLDAPTAGAVAGTIAHLASAADSLDRIRARGDAEQVGPALTPDLVKRAGALLARTATMLGGVVTVHGRFGPDELSIGSWSEARLMPDGYQDLNPETFERYARALLGQEAGQ